jgi:putative transcriptional regulator
VDSLRGKLLLASPSLIDPNFRRTVVLVAAHDDQGALGLVLNRPSELDVSEAVAELAPLTESHPRVHVGGPVAAQSVVVLAEFEDPSLAALLVQGSVGLPHADAPLADLVAAVRRARCFAGHAGWGPGQLDEELEQDAWLVEEAAPDDLWAPPGSDLWGELLRRKGGSYMLLATMPLDPTQN